MKFQNRENKSFTVNDENKERLIWESRSVAVNLVILMLDDSDGKLYVLASKRGPNAADFNGNFNVIAGYLDWDETAPEAVCRETWEETGVNLPDLIFNEPEIFTIAEHLDQPWHVKSDPDSNRQNISLRYGVKFLNKMGSLPKLTTEHNEVIGEVEDPQWMPVDDIDKYKWAFNHKDLIREYVALVSPNTFLDLIKKYPQDK